MNQQGYTPMTGDADFLGQPRGSTSREAREDRIVQTATRLFSDRGYGAVRLNDISDELGVTRAALYYYFSRGKLQILERICELGLDPAEAALTRAASAATSALAIEAFVAGYAPIITSGPSRVYFREASALDPTFRRGLQRRLARITVGVADLFRTGVADGTFRKDLDPDLAANGMLGMINGMAQWRRGEWSPTGATDVALAFAEVIVRGAER